MKQSNCQNCGAPIHDEVCEYCGTNSFMEKDIIKAKTEALKSQKRVEELYSEALKAMRNYSSICTPNELRALVGLQRIDC